MTIRLRRLVSITSMLPAEKQQQVLELAEELYEDEAPHKPPKFYLCPVCFAAAEHRLECHGHLMLPCHADSPRQCTPLIGRDGELKSRAPRWFLQVTSWISD